jgi:hypothetical protein
MDMDVDVEERDGLDALELVMGGNWGERTPRLTSPVLSLSMSMVSMLGCDFEKSNGCAEAERKLEWSVSRIEPD